MHWEAADDDGSSIRDPTTHMGDSDRVPGSWLWPDMAPPVEVIWEINQYTEDLSFSLPFKKIK